MSRSLRPARRTGWGRPSTRVVAVVVTALLAGATGLVGTAAASAATPAAASTGTFTVAGTVQAEARSGVTVTPAVWDDEDGDWTQATTSVAVDATTGAFALKLPAGSSHYTILFETKHIPFLNTVLGGGTELPDDDTLGKAVFTGAKNTTKAVGEIKLVAAGVIEGVITDVAGAPVVGGLVTATPANSDFDYPSSTSTAANGSYYLAVKRGTSYDIDFSDDKYQDTYYPGTEDPDASKPLVTNAANSFHLTGVDLTVKLTKPSVVGAFDDVSDEDNLTEDQFNKLKAARVYIYPVVNGVVSSIPAQTSEGYYEFDFENLDDGDYVMALRDVTSNAWIPTTSNTGTPKIGSAVSGNGCLVPLTLVRGQAVDLGLITFGAAASTPCTAPWGTGEVFSGAVTNMAKGAATDAALYYATSDNSVIDVDRTTVSATGTYSFAAITKPGKYFVQITAGVDAPYFDTAQGGFYPEDDNLKQIIAKAPSIAENTASSGNNVTLITAAIVTGTVTSKGKPLSDAIVAISQLDTPDGGDSLTGDQSYTDKAGRYSLKVRTGSGYTIASLADGYTVQYFDGKDDLEDATLVNFSKPGTDPRRFNFNLRPSSPTLTGIVVTFPLSSTTAPTDTTELKDLSATLYRKIDGYYKKVATTDVPALAGFGNVLQFPAAGQADLVAGDYHVRFTIGKRWIPISEYASNLNLSATVKGPVCFVPVTLAASTPQLFAASVDLTDKTTKCADEPTKKPIVSTGSSGSSPAVISWPSDPAVIAAPTSSSTPTATPTPTVTATPTAEPTATPQPTSTATDAPVASPQSTSVSGSLAWIFVVGGIILAAIIALLIVMVARRQAAAGK